MSLDNILISLLGSYFAGPSNLDATLVPMRLCWVACYEPRPVIGRENAEVMAEFVIKPVGDCALCAEFKNEISVAVNQQVHALDKALSTAHIPGVVETVPAYRR